MPLLARAGDAHIASGIPERGAARNGYANDYLAGDHLVKSTDVGDVGCRLREFATCSANGTLRLVGSNFVIPANIAWLGLTVDVR